MSVSRAELIGSFDDIRSSFLAALDQIVAEMRPAVLDTPGFYDESIVACALAFADPRLVRAQLFAINPDLMADVTDDEVAEAHLTTVSYLLSLAIHEMVRNHRELPS